MRTKVLVQWGLILLAAGQAIPTAWAALSPFSFAHDFPTPDRAWLALFPPYNEHMTQDFGLVGLQFAVVLAYAAAAPHRRLVRMVLLASLVFAVPHLIYHQCHLVRSSDIPLQVTSQVVPIVVALVTLVLNERVRKQPGQK